MNYQPYNYRVYGKTYFCGYDYIPTKYPLYDLESAKEVVNNLDTNVYSEYLIIRHHIQLNMDEPIDRGCLDRPKTLNKRR